MAKDTDNNGTIEDEPIVLKKYLISSNKTEDLIDATILKQVQAQVNE